MIKIIIIAAAAFIVALGGTTALRVFTAKPPVPPIAAAGAPADGPAAEPVGEEHGGMEAEERHDDAPSRKSDAEPEDHLTPVTEGAKIESAADDPPAVVPPVNETAQPPDYKTVSKILGNMKAAESAQILLYLTDEQAVGVLRQMNPRNSAQVLAKIPAERAGALSKMLLNSEGASHAEH